MRRNHHEISITTSPYDSVSSMVTTTTHYPFSNQRPHYNANDQLSSSQSIPICYGPSHFETSYGVMSLSAFNEMHKTTTTNAHFQPLRFDDNESSETQESQLTMNPKSTEGLAGNSSASIENIDIGRSPHLFEGSLYSNCIPFESFSTRNMYPTVNDTFSSREDIVYQKKYAPFPSSLPTPPPLIKSPIPVSTISSLDHSNINPISSDRNKGNIKSQVENELFSFRNMTKSFER